MEMPLVSVVMATYNEPVEYITASIKSILDQNYSKLELIIADDSTNKDTIEAINHFQENDNRVIIIREQKRMGFVPALNKGLRKAKGLYIARMDGDDIAAKNRLQIQVDYLSLFKNVDVLGGCMDIVNRTGEIVSHRNYPSKGLKLLIWTMMRNPLAHPTVMFRRTLIDAGYYYDESFSKAEDLEFWLRLRKAGFKMANTSRKLLKFRVVGDLTNKRAGDNFAFNYKARLKNLSIKYFPLDVLSLAVAKIYYLLPQRIISIIYIFENK